MQIAVQLSLLSQAEDELARGFKLVAARHSQESEIRVVADLLAGWSSAHVELLEPLRRRYGTKTVDEAARTRAAMFHGMRIGGLGLLRDLEDLAVLSARVSISWIALGQTAKALRDADLEGLCVRASEETRRQVAWIETHVKHVAPQALVVPADTVSELRASIPKRPTPAAMLDVLWAPVAGAALVFAAGFTGLLSQLPLLIPSLGATAYLQAEDPAHPTARAWNVVLGQLAGCALGFLAVWLLGAWDAPTALQEGVIAPVRLGAAVLAFALTLGVTIALRAAHPAAGATTLLVALGSVRTGEHVLALAIGTGILVLVGEGLRVLRVGRRPAEAPAREAGGPPSLQPEPVANYG